MEKDRCSLEGCDSRAKYGPPERRLCGKHYQRERRTGSAESPAREYIVGGKQCAHEGCEERARSRGYCKPHYMALWRHGDAGAERRPPRAPECTVDGCERPHKAQGLCEAHYVRLRSTGRVGGAEVASKSSTTGGCAGPECSDEILAAGLCAAHYEQQRSGKALTAKRVYVDREGECLASECQRPRQSEGYCQTHYRRRLAADPDWERPVGAKAPNGAGHLNADGYRVISVNGRPKLEHLHFAEQLLGRPLLSKIVDGRKVKVEEVHHANGNRSDNRIDGPFRLVDKELCSGNLEVWSKAQPSGQAIGPKVEYALEILRLYAPEHLTDAARRAA